MKKSLSSLFSMNNPKTLIIKIALGVSVAAFIFSVVTLIRNIVIGNLVFISVMQVIGAGLIVGICFAMLRIFSGMEEEDEEEDEEEEMVNEAEEQSESSEEKTEDKAANNLISEEPVSDEIDIDEMIESLKDDSSLSDEYDLSLFDEKE